MLKLAVRAVLLICTQRLSMLLEDRSTSCNGPVRQQHARTLRANPQQLVELLLQSDRQCGKINSQLHAGGRVTAG
jgi:hypothetical protein